MGKPDCSRWQILYIIQVGSIQSAGVISPLVNLSKPGIYKIVQEKNKTGVESVKYTVRGGGRRYLLSLGEEADLLKDIEQKVGKGLIKTAHDIRSIVEAKAGKAVSDDYLWDLLNRHGWKKKMPRPHHPKRSKTEQEALKKNSPTMWHPSSGK